MAMKQAPEPLTFCRRCGKRTRKAENGAPYHAETGRVWCNTPGRVTSASPK